MFFKKKSNLILGDIPKVATSPPKKPEKRIKEYFYYRNKVKVTDDGEKLCSELTELGKTELSELSRSELLIYYRSFTDAHKIEVLYNISGNLVCDAKEYAAYRSLLHSLIYYLEVATKEKESL